MNYSSPEAVEPIGVQADPRPIAPDQDHLQVPSLDCPQGLGSQADLKGTWDLDGDGAKEGLVVQHCISGASTPSDTVYLVDSTGSPLLTVSEDADNVSFPNARLSNGELVITFDTWSDQAPRCCPDIGVQRTISFTGTSYSAGPFTVIGGSQWSADYGSESDSGSTGNNPYGNFDGKQEFLAKEEGDGMAESIWQQAHGDYATLCGPILTNAPYTASFMSTAARSFGYTDEEAYYATINLQSRCESIFGPSDAYYYYN